MPRPEKLPAFITDTLDALTELNKVLTGGTFDEENIWDLPDGVLTVTDFMESLTTDTGLKERIDALLDGLGDGSSSEIKKTLEMVQKAIADFIRDVANTANEVNVTGRLEAARDLIAPHSTDPNYDYKPYQNPYNDNKFGLFPALLDIFADRTAANEDAKKAAEALDQLQAMIGIGAAGLVLVDYANGTLNFLIESLTPTASPA